MKRLLTILLAGMLAFAPSALAEVRQGGMYVDTGLGVNGDFRLGNTCVTSPGGTYYCGVNASHLSFFADNTVTMELLYPLASSGNWKTFYTNGSGTITPLAIGNAGYCLKSSGVSAAPVWGDCGTGGGGGATGEAAITSGTIDNVTMGASNDILSIVTEDLQVSATSAELDAGATIPDAQSIVMGSEGWSITYDSTNDTLRDSTTQYNGSTDDTPMRSVRVNSAGGTLDPGQVITGVMDYTTLVASVRKDTTGKYDAWIKGDSKADTHRSNLGDGNWWVNKCNTIAPQWTNTLGAEYVDCNNLYGVLQQGAGQDSVITYRKTQSKSFVVPAIASTHDFLFWKSTFKAKLTKITGICSSGTNVIGQIQICDSSGASCADTQSSDTTFTTSGVSNTSFSAGTIDAADWVKFKTTSVSGTVDFFTVTFEYYETF
jgi:hypothetical protein